MCVEFIFFCMNTPTHPALNYHLKKLKKSGCRMTPLVQKTLQLFFRDAKTISVQQTHAYLCSQLGYNLSVPTVYRLLDRLNSQGVLQRLHRFDAPVCYFACPNPTGEHHHHFICCECGSVSDVAVCLEKTFQRKLQKSLQAQITNHILQLEGICKKCQNDS